MAGVAASVSGEESFSGTETPPCSDAAEREALRSQSSEHSALIRCHRWQITTSERVSVTEIGDGGGVEILH